MTLVSRPFGVLLIRLVVSRRHYIKPSSASVESVVTQQAQASQDSVL
jgi:hypothetical protein